MTFLILSIPGENQKRLKFPAIQDYTTHRNWFQYLVTITVEIISMTLNIAIVLIYIYILLLKIIEMIPFSLLMILHYCN